MLKTFSRPIPDYASGSGQSMEEVEARKVKDGAVKAAARRQMLADAVERSKAAGVQAFKQKNFELALHSFRSALQLLGDTGMLDAGSQTSAVALHSNCAMVNLKLNRFSDAVANADAVLAFEPQNLKALYRRAQGRMALSQWTGAEADLKVVIDANRAPASGQAEATLVELSRRKAAAPEAEVLPAAVEAEAAPAADESAGTKNLIEEIASASATDGPAGTKILIEEIANAPAADAEEAAAETGATYDNDDEKPRIEDIDDDAIEEINPSDAAMGQIFGAEHHEKAVKQRQNLQKYAARTMPKETESADQRSVRLLLQRFPKWKDDQACEALDKAHAVLRKARNDSALTNASDGKFVFMRTQQALALLTDRQLAPLVEARGTGDSAESFGVTGLVMALVKQMIEGGIYGGGESEGAGARSETAAKVLVRHVMGAECDEVLGRLLSSREVANAVENRDGAGTAPPVSSFYAAGWADTEPRVARLYAHAAAADAALPPAADLRGVSAFYAAGGAAPEPRVVELYRAAESAIEKPMVRFQDDAATIEPEPEEEGQSEAHAAHLRTVLEAVLLTKRVKRYRGEGEVSGARAVRDICEETMTRARAELSAACERSDPESVAEAMVRWEELGPELRDEMRSCSQHFEALQRQLAKMQIEHEEAERIRERERSKQLSNRTIKARVAVLSGQYHKSLGIFEECFELARPGELMDTLKREMVEAAEMLRLEKEKEAEKAAAKAADRAQEQKMRDMLEATRQSLLATSASIKSTLKNSEEIANASLSL